MSKRMIKKSELDEAIKKDPAMTNKPYFRWFAYLFFAIDFLHNPLNHSKTSIKVD